MLYAVRSNIPNKIEIKLRKIKIVIDEAQNLTLQEIRTIIIRAGGEGMNTVFAGDNKHIHSPYLDT